MPGLAGYTLCSCHRELGPEKYRRSNRWLAVDHLHVVLRNGLRYIAHLKGGSWVSWLQILWVWQH